MQDVIRTAVEDALQELGVEPIAFSVEHPADLSHGDYAVNVAMVVAKQLGKNPRDFATELTTALEGQIEYVEKIEVAGPGFINFFLVRDFFAEEIARSVALSEDWGKNRSYQDTTILLEYTSPNLFKPLHVGNLVGNIIGESLTRIYEFAGANVQRLNYPSDIGLTVAKAVWGLRHTGADPTDLAAIGAAYRDGNEAYEREGAEKEEIIALNQALYAGTDEALMALRAQGLATSQKSLDVLCERLGTTFDTVIPESIAAPEGVRVVNEHIGNIFEKSDGAVVYKGEKVGLHTRVFLNSKGLPTYEAKDLGNFALKQKQYPEWDESIIVTGGEQTEYFKVVYAAIKEIFSVPETKKLIHVPTGFLTLTTGKMSSRKGNVLTGESILADLEAEAGKRSKDTEVSEQVAVAALKYQILRHSVGSNIVFDKEKALSFEGDSGPYLQYTHARINSVLERASEAGIEASFARAPETPYDIEKILYRFPEVVESALHDREPHQVVTFLTELAGAFNTFYAHEKIADATDEYAAYKAAVADAVRQTLKNGLWILGIKAPQSM